MRIKTLLVTLLGITTVTTGGFTYYYGTKKAPSLFENTKIAILNSTAPTMAPKYVASIRGKTPEAELLRPQSVAVAPNGRIFVADTGHARVVAFDPNGDFLFQFGNSKNGLQLGAPNGVLAANGEVYVSDSTKNRIVVFDESGTYKRQITAQGLGVGLIPLAMTFDANQLYVASAPGYIYVINQDGKLVKTIGEPGGKDGYLGYPSGLAIRDNQLIISDTNNQRVTIYDMDGKLVSLKKTLSLSLPTSMTLDRWGRVVVVDTFSHDLIAVDREFKSVFRFGKRGVEDGEFNFPVGVTTDSTGKFYVADRENNRIAVFGY